MSGSFATELADEARAAGFEVIAVARPDAVAAAGEQLRAWIADGKHGEMAWMADRLNWRSDPLALWPEVRSVIMLGQSYAPGTDPMEVLQRPDHGAISVYAQGKDYHDVVKKRLKRVGRWLIDQAGGEIKVFVDTAPVMEKPLAEAAGLGWQGKHTNLVSQDLGSWFFLGAIFSTLELAAGAPHADRCGTCRRCLDICPTAAFPAPYQLDARRCISYLTIELKGPIPRNLRPAIGNRIYGCDDCLAVCPWNRFAQAGNDAYRSRPETDAPHLADLVALDDTAFRQRFRGSPIKRIGRGRFVRNVLVAIGNSGNENFAHAVSELLNDPDPLVRGAAIWAMSRLIGHERTLALCPIEPDPEPSVVDEWDALIPE